ncbi:hypothetical protein HN747_00465 [archaeon]|jgi:hypothetical protein|nr:hypothetical protein [archaeon]
MENKKTYGVLALGMMALLSIGLVAAYQGDYSVQGPNYSDERHEAMEDAFDNLDYDAWVSLMSEDGRHPRVLNVVTEDNFVTFVEAHDAMEDGDFDRAAELRAELGLNNGMGPKDGTGSKMGQGSGSGKGQGRGSIQGSRMRDQTNCIYSN